jgi:uncharacterized protein YkwD
VLAGLVLASFTVTPQRQAPVIVAPSDDVAAEARIAPVSRGTIRWVRDVDAALSPPSPPIPEPNDLPAPEAVAETQPEATVASEPEATPDVAPEPEATPDPTPKPTPRPATPRPAPPRPAFVTNATTLWAEGHMLELINASRARAGLVALGSDVTVADTARAHSAVEAQFRYVYHDGPDGLAGSRNVPACGTGWYGENTGKIWNDNVDALHIEFMNEPWAPINHRTNIMDPAFRRVGVGAVIGADAMYMTMVFCR